MFVVYILKSKKDNGWYIGYSADLPQRISQHNNGECKSTRARRPLQVIYVEGYLDKRDALGREKFLKSGAGRRFLLKQMKHYLNTE